MTTVIVAEKPSVARDLARVLGARARHEGFIEGQGYRITWALGHLVHFAEPDAYGAAWAGRWSFGQLPMIPERWRLRTEARTAAQFKQVKALLTAADTERVICATDAGREGELIFRLIVEHARCRKPIERLWVSSLTDEAIRAGLARLRPGADYGPLAAAARARAQADWLVGMNLTRAYSVHNRVLCTIGRVQTPTLAMICARDAAIASFTKAYFYELVAHLAEGFEARWARDGQTRIDDKREAERLHRQLLPHKTGTVTAVEVKVRRNRPPPLYDLTNLQRDANRRFGLTAARVLELAQTLYETHKLISYPRTESRHIGEDMLPQLPGILAQVDHPLAGEALARLKGGHRLGKAYVDRTRLTDHHAILPTARRPPPGLPQPLRQIYDLVATRFVAVFLPDQQVEETGVTLDIGGETFIAKGSRVLDPGWKRAEPQRRPPAAGDTPAVTPPGGDGKPPAAGSAAAGPGADPQDRPLPPVTKGQTVHVDRLEVQEKETQPPRPYDDATLLNAMKHAGREIEDDALAAAMKGSGLGTPATRAEIIEKLLRTGYIERQRKQLRATDKGRALIALVAEPLRSPELTARWEQRLQDIERGEGDAEGFYRDICGFLTELIPRVAAGPAMTAEQQAAARAAQEQRGGRKAGGRSTGKGRRTAATEPKVARTPQSAGTAAPRAQAKRGTRTPDASAPTRPRSGARPRSTPITTAKPRPAPPPTSQTADTLTAAALPCPKCGQGRVIAGRRGYGCSRWREGCDFVIWKETAGHRLTEPELIRLLREGRLGPLPELIDADGQSLSGSLWLDAGGRVRIKPLGAGSDG
jgi:DNA topoisomerase-3